MKYPLIILVLLLGSLSLSAQIEREPVLSGKMDTIGFKAKNDKENKQSQKDRLKELDLTKDQKAKVKEIRQSGKAAKEAIENNAELTDADKKKQTRLLQREQAQKIQAILTEEQRAKFKASKENNP